jgi:hypothetical protein
MEEVNQEGNFSMTPNSRQPKRLSTRDAQGRRWKVRTRQYQVGWIWDAALAGDSIGVVSGDFFPSKEAARADAHATIARAGQKK